MRFGLKEMRALLLLGSVCAGLTGQAGNIRGHVSGVIVPPASPLATGNSATNVAETAETKADRLRDYVIYVESAVVTNFPPPFRPVNVQIRRNAKEDAVFSPRVLPVLVGTSVVWRNEDAVYHQLFSLSDDATFEFPACPPGGVAATWKFEKPGQVQVFCSLYANLNGVVLVLENPWFSGADFRDNYFIQNVPAGTYTLTLWREHTAPQSQQITVPATGEIKADFTLTPSAR